ncbi:MAG: thiamine phosphate synthase [Cellvibrionaceae bacterium]|nr:thiamine phosphate synthase [Cellvibrionaceae bacterium]
MSPRRKVLIIAGSDSSGLAGVQRDNHTVLALGCHPVNVLTAITAQNASGVVSVNPCSHALIESQLQAVNTQAIAAVKIGLVCSAQQIKTLAKFLKSLPRRIPIVIDPVMAASSGEAMQSSETKQALLDELLPLCDLVTPNLTEAAALSAIPIAHLQDIPAAAARLLAAGAKNVLVKGGHYHGEPGCHDYFCASAALPSSGHIAAPATGAAAPQSAFWLSSPRLASRDTRGSGCSLASAICCALALGFSMHDAQVIGKMALNQGIRNAYSLEDQPGPVAVAGFPKRQQDVPSLSYGLPLQLAAARFPEPSLPDGTAAALGLYPVVDSVEWLQRLLPCGVSTIQLRIKDKNSEELDSEVQRAVALARQYNCRLFINDYWQLAIKHRAYGVHLGQEDLADAQLDEIRRAGLRLGLSTHCHYEVARALSYRPSYIAFGPVFHTDTKTMPWLPQGAAGFAYWREVLDYPMVAIGGIKREHVGDLLAKGAEGIAMITAITEAEAPEATAGEFVELIKSKQSAESFFKKYE